MEPIIMGRGFSMKKRNSGFKFILICIAVFLITFTVFAELSLDSALLQINTSGRSDYGYFRTQMTLSFNISTQRVDYFHTTLRMGPGDIFMVFEVASICGISVDRVVKVYGVQKKNGWGAIARQLGIKPGSAQFKLLKSRANGFNGKLKIKKNKGGISNSGNSNNGNSNNGKKGGGKK
jgi:hypothetical protein